MPEPISIFSAKFLYYESTESPTEILAEIILKKIENPIPTSVFIVLYSHGFYVKGNLQHISYDQTKSRPYQFFSVELLRKVYQFPIQNNSLVMVFHETTNLIFEVILFLFPLNLIKECNQFHNYLQTLLNDRFCSNKTFELLSMKSEDQYLKDLSEKIDNFDNKNQSIEIPISKSTLNENKNESFNLWNSVNSDGFDDTASEEILDSSYLSDSSNDLNNVFYKKVNTDYQIPVKCSDRIQITNENIETFIEETIYKTKKSSLFFDDQPETLNSIDSIETFCQNEDSTDLYNDFENGSNIHFDQRDSFSSLSNITEDFRNTNEASIADLKHLSIHFPNENQTRKLLDSLNSIEEYKFDNSGSLPGENFNFQEENVQDLSIYKNNYSNNNFNDNLFSNSQNRNRFCWPDFLKSEPKFTTSILVEMSFSYHQLNNNWSLIDKRDSLTDKISPKLFEWYEKVDRLHYNYKKKNFETDENGSLVIYCCRQIGHDSD